MKITGFLFLVFALISYPFSSYAVPKKNLEVLDSLAAEAAKEAMTYIVKTGSDKYAISIKPIAVSWILENPLTTALVLRGTKLFTPDSNNLHPLVDINITKLGVTYTNDKNEKDTLIRNCTVEIEGVILKNKEYSPLPSIVKSYSDRIARDEVLKLEGSMYEFTKGEVPENGDWFYDNFLEPVIVIGCAAITVILLFTVRSQ